MATTVGVFITGDSISFSGTLAGEDAWPYLLSANPSLINEAAASQFLTTHLEPAYAGQVAALPSKYTIAIIQGGVNDIKNGVALSSIQTALTSMVTTAVGSGMTVLVCGVAPWKNATGWSAAYQTVTDDYNAWLSSQAATQGFTYIDVYTPLEDSVTADALDSAYDPGDGLHPNTAGATVYAAQVDAELPSFTQITPMNNSVYMWRGAVEPAETSPSGNEIKLWRGAVEPSAPSINALIGGVTRSVTRTLTRGVTEGWGWGA